MNPTQAEVDAVARQLLATVEDQAPATQVTIITQGKALSSATVADMRRKFELLNWLRTRKNNQRTYPAGCTCQRMPVDGPPQVYDWNCPIPGHQRLAKG